MPYSLVYLCLCVDGETGRCRLSVTLFTLFRAAVYTVMVIALVDGKNLRQVRYRRITAYTTAVLLYTAVLRYYVRVIFVMLQVRGTSNV